MKTSYELTSGSGSIATARWADPDYIAEEYAYDPDKGDIFIGRNPHRFEEAIGQRDERHIMVCAGAGSGKGRSFIIPNLCLYPGSIINYDPKGELPYILAPRRGDGNQYCKGMGQEVYVLDPLRRSGVEEKYLGYYDPVSFLDPDDPELTTWCKRLATSLVKQKESATANEWTKKGIAFARLVIEHVVTDKSLAPEKRNLRHILTLITLGDKEGADRINQVLKFAAEEKNAVLPEDQQITPKTIDPYTALLRAMRENQHGSNSLREQAEKLERESKTIDTYFAYVSGEAGECLAWLGSKSMERVTGGWGDESRHFDPKTLKTRRVSLFIVLPIDDLDEYEPWLQSLFVGIFAAMREQRIKPDIPVLGILDEFSSLGYQEYIASSLDNIRSAGMKLVFILQNYGSLKQLYGDKMESFFSNSCLELYFGRVGNTAADRLKMDIGDTEVVKHVHSINRSENESEAIGKSIAFGETTSKGGSVTDTKGRSTSHSEGIGFSFSEGVNWQNSDNYGVSEGTNMGRNYGPHVFFRGFRASSNYGTSLNRNQGNTRSKGSSKNKTRNRQQTTQEGTSTSQAISSSWQTGTSRTETDTRTTTKGYQIGGGVAETYHKKPLLDLHEINSFLRAIPEKNRDHPAYPGLMLVRLDGESPLLLRRSNYDQDPLFEGCFSKDPVHEFLPLSQQPMLGYEYTPDNILTFQLPALLRDNGFTVEPAVRGQRKVEAGDVLFSCEGPDHPKTLVESPVSGRVVGISGPEEFQETRHILAVKSAQIFDDHATLNVKKQAFSSPLKVVKASIAEEQRRRDEQRQQEEQQRERERQQREWAQQQREKDERNKLYLRLLCIGGAIALLLAMCSD